MIKEIKTALQTLGMDIAILQNWKKLYDKTKKQLPAVTTKYQSAKKALREADTKLSRLEQLMVAGVEWNREEQKEIQNILKQLKKLKNLVCHEFLVSKEDKEFHLILNTILKLGAKICKRKEDRLLLKSEIENILALIRENLEKEQPDLLMLSFFYLQHNDTELVNLPPTERLKKISQVYQDAFLDPLCDTLTIAIDKADCMKSDLESRNDRKSARILKSTEVLFVNGNSQEEKEQKVQKLIKQLMNES